MAQSTFSIRMDGELKKKFDAFCEEIGMSSSVAFTIFAKKVVRDQKIPFALEIPAKPSLEEGLSLINEIRENAKNNGTADMSMDEIDAEIAAARRERKKNEPRGI